MRVVEQLVTVKAGSRETGQAIFLFEEQTPKVGGGPPPHIHRTQDEAFYILAGRFEFQIGEETTKAAPGDFLVGPKGIPHAYRLVEGDRGKLLVFLWPGNGLEDFFEEVGEPVDAPVRPPDVERLVRLAQAHGLDILPPPSEPE